MMTARERAVCPVCNLDYAVTKAGRIGRHHGMDPAGFSTGKPCEGVGAPASPVSGVPAGTPASTETIASRDSVRE